MTPVYSLFINGAFVPAHNGETFDSINPYNQTLVATFARGRAADINKAVEAYQSGDPLKCITLLAKPYGTELQTLITFSNENEETASISIKAADLRNTLLRHGFHPDGVGFLLVMLGEILASGQLKLKQTAVSSQLDQSKDLFLCAAERLPEQLQCSLHIMPVLPKNLKQYKNCYILIEANQKLYYIYAPYEAGETSEKDQMLVLFEEEVKIADYSKFENVLNSLRAGKKNVSLLDNQIAELITSNGGHVPTIKPLMRKALKLDETIRIWRPRSNQTILNKFRRFVIVEYNGVPDEYLDRCLKESNEAPYVGRLREIQLVAQLNSALVQMIIGRDDNLDLARDYIVKMYEAIHYNYHYFVPIEVRLLTLEDFLSALGYDPEFKLKKDTFQQYAVLEHMPRRIFNEDGQAKSVISFITQLNQPIDILNIICTLSDGVLNISYETFKNKLENNRTILNCNLLLEELEKKVNLDCWLLKSEYLPVLSQLFKIKFELYKSIVENNACRYIPLVEQPVAPEQPKVTICLVVDEQKYYEDKKNLPKLLFVFQKEAELIDITQRIDSASTEAELSAAYLAKAHFYYKTAAQIKSHARSLIQYEAALESYERALQFRIKSNEPNKEACWGVIKCQLMLGQVNQCLSFLNQRAQEFVYYEKFWYYKAQVLRRLQKYVESNTFIQKALEINSQNTAFDDERKKIQKLQKTNEIMEIYKTTHLQNDEQYYKTRQQMKMEELPNYNILSMDGGGIRGIIPAVVLSEIERQIGRPIAHNFDLCAGTSTGGLISLLLTVPDKHNATCPKYRASDILQLYTTRGKDIFTTDHRNWIERNVLQNILNLASSKYSATGRNNLCDEYFEKYKLADCLTEVVIPATLQRRPNITNFFSRYEAKKKS